VTRVLVKTALLFTYLFSRCACRRDRHRASAVDNVHALGQGTDRNRWRCSVCRARVSEAIGETIGETCRRACGAHRRSALGRKRAAASSLLTIVAERFNVAEVSLRWSHQGGHTGMCDLESQRTPPRQCTHSGPLPRRAGVFKRRIARRHATGPVAHRSATEHTAQCRSLATSASGIGRVGAADADSLDAIVAQGLDADRVSRCGLCGGSKARQSTEWAKTSLRWS